MSQNIISIITCFNYNQSDIEFFILEKEKKQEEDRIEVDKKVMELQFTKLRRVSEMKLLYGDDAPKIIGMETAVQLSFNKYCDMKGPKYWPNIPLNL